MSKKYLGPSIFGSPESEDDNISLDDLSENVDEISTSARRESYSPIAGLSGVPEAEIYVSEEGEDEQVGASSGNIQIGTKEAVVWRSRTKTEIGLYESLKRLESTDLTRQLVNAHGISAQQYTNIREKDIRYRLRPSWTEDWTPRRTWSMWPLKPTNVPRRLDRVWGSSIAPEEKWTPSRDLEDEIFALMLKKARRRWPGDATADTHKVDEIKGSNETLVREARDEDIEAISPRRASVATGSPIPELMTRKRKFHDIDPDMLDQPVISTDDDHSRRISQPLIRTTLSKLDEVLLALQKSFAHAYKPHQSERLKKGPQCDKGKERPSEVNDNYSGESSTAPSKRDYDSSKRSNKLSRKWHVGLLDWSQVLGIAAIAGVSSEVISRTATRCAALFNEEMEFQTLCEDEVAPGTMTRHKFGPKDILSLDNQSNKLAPTDVGDNWDIQKGCPIQDCSLYGRQLVESGFNEADIQNHVVQVHNWIGANPPKDLVDFIGTDGGGAVHRDGYLTPLQREYSTMRGVLPKNIELKANHAKDQQQTRATLPPSLPPIPILSEVSDETRQIRILPKPVALRPSPATPLILPNSAPSRRKGGRPRLNPRLRQPDSSAQPGLSRLIAAKPLAPISQTPGDAGTTDDPIILD
jgi:hypothetical protein